VKTNTSAEGIYNMAPDKYEDFAERYGLFFDNFDKHDPVLEEFFSKLFTENEVNTVLDCACGTGRDLYLFHSLGCEVSGCDISEAMLGQAQENLSKNGLDIPVQRADFRELPKHYFTKFDAVTCLSSSIMEMPNEVEVLEAFRSMRKILNTGGILVLTQGTTDKQWEEKPRFIPAVNTRDFSRVFVIDYNKKGAKYNILDIFHDDETLDFEVWSIDYPRIFLKDDMDRMLKAAGFRSIDYYGTYEFDPYDKEESDVLIVIATK
jgi:SAM-dependent methyltransferase